jgi:hypothetical protein
MSTLTRVGLLIAIAACQVGIAFGASSSTLTLSGVEPGDTSRFGGGLTPKLNRGDLLFYAPFPTGDQLSGVEKVMVVGGRHDGSSVQPWFKVVVNECRVYHQLHHSVPTSLTPEILAEDRDVSASETESFVFFKNPFLSNWVNCQAAIPSAGDIYCRPLTREEANYVAQDDPLLAKLLKGESDDNSGDHTMLIGDVWYVRVYGENGRVIYAGLDYIWTSDNSRS